MSYSITNSKCLGGTAWLHKHVFTWEASEGVRKGSAPESAKNKEWKAFLVYGTSHLKYVEYFRH